MASRLKVKNGANIDEMGEKRIEFIQFEVPEPDLSIFPLMETTDLQMDTTQICTVMSNVESKMVRLQTIGHTASSSFSHSNNKPSLLMGNETLNDEMVLGCSDIDPEEVELKKEALRAAHEAVSKQKKMTSLFDNECLMLRQGVETEQDSSGVGSTNIDLLNPSTMPKESTVQTPKMFKGMSKLVILHFSPLVINSWRRTQIKEDFNSWNFWKTPLPDIDCNVNSPVSGYCWD